MHLGVGRSFLPAHEHESQPLSVVRPESGRTSIVDGTIAKVIHLVHQVPSRSHLLEPNLNEHLYIYILIHIHIYIYIYI